ITTENCNDYDLAVHFAEKIKNYSTSPHRNKPFFLACGFFRPHAAWHSPKYFWDLFNRDSLTIPPGYHPQDEPGNYVHQEIVRDTLWMKAIHGYLASCALADYNVGVVMKALENSPYKDNTIVLFMGDHGWHLGEKGHWGKFDVWEEANKTTFIIYDPSAKANGSECLKPVSLQDVYPTLVDIAGIPQKTNIEGNSLAQLLINSNDPKWKHPIITRDGTSALVIRTEKWRYIDDGNNKLFNMIEDPYQWNNLYGQPNYKAVTDSLIHLRDSVIQIGTDLKNKLLNGYSFTPSIHSIPGTIEAEDYNEGTNGHTYHDLSPGNLGSQYRTRDDTDIEISTDATGAFNISNIEHGEWLEYAITNYEAGTYDFKFRISNNNTSSVRRKIKVLVNNEPKGEVIVTATDANEWKDIVLPEISIEETQHLSIRLEFVIGGFKLNSFHVLKKAADKPFAIYYDGSEPILQNSIVDKNESIRLDLFQSSLFVKVEILNAQGKKLMEEHLIGELMVDFNLNNTLKPGTYFMRMNDGIRTKTEKFIVK
ncbi:MAG: sulfatase-like hydrolase/transferase, partial [Bacteroidales bacterium]|nr:sulfatase-like hydrolase/transferase [Bacteroidales bacterium]